MQLSDFHFELPPDRIARYPLEKRSASRLLCVDPLNGEAMHRQFSDVLSLLNEGDLLVFNNTKVIKARLKGKKITGGQVEILVERLLNHQRMLAQLRVSKAPKIGGAIFLSTAYFTIINRQEQFYELQLMGTDQSLLQIIESEGHIPLPPYLHREPDERDKERYQTVYAKHQGSVAAPTAGFHFDDELLDKIYQKNIEIGYLTLHIGAGTFAPIRTNAITEHQMHAEYLEVSTQLCAQIQRTKAAGNRVIAVGTTTLRALETAAAKTGLVEPYQGDTTIFIYPGHVFHSADVLITNLHLPQSTLLMLVSAFGGYPSVMEAYRIAIRENYRFYSYGDAMWIPRHS